TDLLRIAQRSGAAQVPHDDAPAAASRDLLVGLNLRAPPRGGTPSEAMHWRLTRLLVTGALALGCSQETGTGASPIVTAITEPVLPTSTLGTAAREVPAWMEELPAAEASLAEGERAWAAVGALPRAGVAEDGAFQDDPASEGGDTHVGRMGQRLRGVPAAVCH